MEIYAALDIPDSESETEYWDKHAKIALQSLHMALISLAKVVNVVDGPSLVRISNATGPMIQEFSVNTRRRIDRLNSGRK